MRLQGDPRKELQAGHLAIKRKQKEVVLKQGTRSPCRILHETSFIYSFTSKLSFLGSMPNWVKTGSPAVCPCSKFAILGKCKAFVLDPPICPNVAITAGTCGIASSRTRSFSAKTTAIVMSKDCWPTSLWWKRLAARTPQSMS